MNNTNKKKKIVVNNMETIKERQLRILNETISLYNSNNRCIQDNSFCSYHIEGKIGCAIGRLIVDKELCKKLDGIGGIEPYTGERSAFYHLPDDIKELGVNYLIDLQSLHDNKWNWTETGLSDLGEKRIIGIKHTYELC